jgi:hypothetical protein
MGLKLGHFQALQSTERQWEKESMLLMLKKLAGSCSLVDRGRKEREKKRAFLNNVGLALEKLVASFNGRPPAYSHPQGL